MRTKIIAIALALLVLLVVPLAPAGAAPVLAFSPQSLSVSRGTTSATLTVTINEPSPRGIVVTSLFYVAGSSICNVSSSSLSCPLRIAPNLRPGKYIIQVVYFSSFGAAPIRTTGMLTITP